eukprot:CAMPEP_0203775052 /NCGR_PEP_ID=MMETSP0099_2-20121227/5793_1 /ASSEMBLY_ACC=CAM_ASM_000209 /TAXON_ID=96639 /ORGANISM=" , Strain NY0313808BC1" /LENGTH=476 /DNA_ID=CAMNT_0050673539 /DNA_START=1 /DNA_END=1427 /DNA_ORIENTATION=-
MDEPFGASVDDVIERLRHTLNSLASAPQSVYLGDMHMQTNVKKNSLATISAPGEFVPAFSSQVNPQGHTGNATQDRFDPLLTCHENWEGIENALNLPQEYTPKSEPDPWGMPTFTPSYAEPMPFQTQQWNIWGPPTAPSSENSFGYNVRGNEQSGGSPNRKRQSGEFKSLSTEAIKRERTRQDCASFPREFSMETGREEARLPQGLVPGIHKSYVSAVAADPAPKPKQRPVQGSWRDNCIAPKVIPLVDYFRGGDSHPFHPEKFNLSSTDLQMMVRMLNHDLNEGYGCVPIKNHFTCGREPSLGLDPELPPKDSPFVILYLVKHRSGRYALYQGLNTFAGVYGEDVKVESAIGQDVVISSDGQGGGEAFGKLLVCCPLRLTPGLPEVPFMPVLRLATRIDRALVETRKSQERILLDKAKALFCKYVHKGRAVNGANVCKAELQLDLKRLLIFIDYQDTFPWNTMLNDLYEFVKKTL